MKFVRENQGKKLHKTLLADPQQQNRRPSENNTDSQTQMKQKNTEMEIEELTFDKKEQQIYEAQITQYLATQQNTITVDAAYFSRQTDITEHMRSVLLNWLVDVHLKYKLQPETLFLTVYLIDTYLEKKVISRTQLQLVGISALWIAAKYEQTYQVPKLTNLVAICDSTYTRQQILEMEGEIISVVGFDILKSHSLHYFNTVNRYIKLTQKDYYLGRYMLEICLFQMNLYKYSPKIIACSIFFFINKLRKKDNCWSLLEANTFKVSQEELRPCARDICSLWQRAQISDTMSSLRMKFMSSRFKQVAKIKLGPSAPSNKTTTK